MENTVSSPLLKREGEINSEIIFAAGNKLV